MMQHSLSKPADMTQQSMGQNSIIIVVVVIIIINHHRYLNINFFIPYIGKLLSSTIMDTLTSHSTQAPPMNHNGGSGPT